MIGEFEYLVIATVVRLGDEAYGAAIRLEFEQTAQRACSIGALYTTLDRLETKGFIQTWLGDPTPERGGRAKRMVRITREGAQAAAHFYETVLRASHGTAWEEKLAREGAGK